MGKGRPKSDFEPLSERPGFRASSEQVEWLKAASRAHGFVNLSAWLRHLVIVSGEPKLGKPFPLPENRKTPRKKR
jgi:hypothetical protein